MDESLQYFQAIQLSYQKVKTMKGFIVASLAIFAIACVDSHPHHQSIDNWQDLKTKKEELKTKLIGMSDDEYVTFRDQHLSS